MAKYCTNCGKKLEDGKPCDCQKEVVINNKLINNCLEIAKGMVTSPIDTIKGYTKKQTFNTAMILVGVMSILAGLFAMALLKAVVKGIGTLMGASFGMSYYTGSSYGTMDISYLKIFLVVAIVSFALSFVYAGLLYLVNTIIFKRESSFKENYSLYGVVSIVTSATLAVSTIVGFLNIYVGVVLFSLGSLLQLVYLYHGLKFLGAKDENKYGYIYLITTVFFSIVIFIITKIFS